MKTQYVLGLGFLFLTAMFVFLSPALGQDESRKPETRMPDKANTVIVMGMIHRGHRQSGPFDIDHLKALIKDVNPDYVLTEIPPDRLEEATTQFQETGVITEPRVKVFPEYVDALFPLTKELEFEIIPCAAWNTAMNDSRRATLQKAKTTHAKEYAEMEAGQAEAGRNIATLGDSNDPVIIHTQQFDDFVKSGMEPYDRHFNEMIGEGGWTNINAGHYGLIEKALEEHAGEGKTFLITFGSWHKYYIKEQLRKRTDINLVSMSEYLKETHTPADWPRFRLNLSGNNSYGATEIQNPVVSWGYDTGDVIESSPVVVGDVVYVGGHSSRLHAINRETGRLIWKFEVGGWLRATPAVVDGVVYFGADDNKFYAVDAKTGEKKWDFPLGEGGEQSSPTIEDGVVYFGAFDNFVYALDAESGQEIWKFDAGSSMLSSPFLNENSLFIGTYEGKFFSIDRKTGKKNWMFTENDQPIFSSPVANSEIVSFTSYDKHVYGVNITDGSIKWKHETNGQIFSSPTMVGKTIYVGSNDSHLYALETDSGKPRWKTDLNGAVFSSPAVTDHSVYVGSSDGHVYAVNRADGSVRWKHLVGKDVKVWTSPVAIQGELYFGSHAGEVIRIVEKGEPAK
jgi:outer membrane protein assembly factor BamB